MSRRPLPPPRTTGAADVLRSRYQTNEPDDDPEPLPVAAAPEHPSTDAEEDRTSGVVTSVLHDVTTPRSTDVAKSSRRDSTTPRRRDVTKSRSGRPSATSERTVAFTVRFDSDEADAHLQMLLKLKRAGRLKSLPDKSQVIRVALQMIDDDPELQRQVLDRL